MPDGVVRFTTESNKKKETAMYHDIAYCKITYPVEEGWQRVRRSLREKFVKIGAEVICHARYVTFQMIEVAIPRAPFETTLG